MLRLLNACFGLPCGHELPALRDLGVQGIRSDCQHLDAETTLARTQEILDAGLMPLIVVSTIEQLALLPSGTNVELLNEPDLEGPKNPRDYGKLVDRFAPVCQERNLSFFAGAVSNFNGRGFSYMEKAGVRTWAENVNVSMHFYAHKDSPHDPHPGFKSREHEMETFKTLIGSRRWGLSEFGYRTSLSTAPASINFEWAFAEKHGAEFAALFQLNDGQGKGEHWGIRDVSGNWKPAAETFRRTV